MPTETAFNEIINPEIDPFSEPLETPPEERLILNDTYFAAARDVVTVDGMDYSFLKPPYMNFDDHIKTKRKLREAYTQNELLLMYGYSGCGKTTILTQFSEKNPRYVHLIKDFGSLSPAQMLVKMGEAINVPIKQRTGEIETLKEKLKTLRGQMFLFDETNADTPSAITKLEMLRKIRDESGTPIVICGIPRLHHCIYASDKFDLFCSLISRMDEHELHGMRRQDAGEYIKMVAEKENLQFTYPAQQALITAALNINIGGINAFTTIMGRCITLARVHYFTAPGRSIPDNAKCVRYEVPDETSYPGAKLVLTLPITPERIQITEQMVSQMQAEYKSHFPQEKSKATRPAANVSTQGT